MARRVGGASGAGGGAAAAGRSEHPSEHPGDQAQATGMRRRIQALEAELAEARRGLEARAAELEKIGALEITNAELRRVAEELERALGQRTIALAESEAELRRLAAELEHANQLKSEFMAIAAHELRSPMQTILGYLEMIERGRFGEPPPPLGRPLGLIGRNARRLRRLVEGLVDASRIASGGLALRRSTADPRLLLAEVAEDAELFLYDRGQSVAIAVDDAVGSVDVDADRVHQALLSFIVGVARQAPDGGAVRVRAQADGEERIALAVRAGGAGISPEVRQRIFEPFSSVVPVRNHSSAPSDPGGLGLYIAKQIVELHGGTVTLESRKNDYAAFLLTLPLAEPTTPAR